MPGFADVAKVKGAMNTASTCSPITTLKIRRQRGLIGRSSAGFDGSGSDVAVARELMSANDRPSRDAFGNKTGRDEINRRQAQSRHLRHIRRLAEPQVGSHASPSSRHARCAYSSSRPDSASHRLLDDFSRTSQRLNRRHSAGANKNPRCNRFGRSGGESCFISRAIVARITHSPLSCCSMLGKTARRQVVAAVSGRPRHGRPCRSPNAASECRRPSAERSLHEPPGDRCVRRPP